MDTAACLIYPSAATTAASTTMKKDSSLQKPHKIHTPPTRLGAESTVNTDSIKTKFSDSPEKLASEQQELEGLLLSPVSPAINHHANDENDENNSGTIYAQEIPDDMLVAMIDRPAEMKQLVHHNATFFEQLQHELQSTSEDSSNSSTCWRRFKYTLYCDRSTLSDMEWMTRISKALSRLPTHYLSHFKVLVGYIGDEQKQQVNMMGKEFLNVKLVRLRRLSGLRDKISKKSYPQFFINCEKALQNDNAEQRNGSTTYHEFMDLLFHTEPDQLPDQEWEKRMDNILKSRPNLLEQLQEIAAYELEDDGDEDEE